MAKKWIFYLHSYYHRYLVISNAYNSIATRLMDQIGDPSRFELLFMRIIHNERVANQKSLSTLSYSFILILWLQLFEIRIFLGDFLWESYKPFLLGMDNVSNGCDFRFRWPFSTSSEQKSTSLGSIQDQINRWIILLSRSNLIKLTELLTIYIGLCTVKW